MIRCLFCAAVLAALLSPHPQAHNKAKPPAAPSRSPFPRFPRYEALLRNAGLAKLCFARLPSAGGRAAKQSFANGHYEAELRNEILNVSPICDRWTHARFDSPNQIHIRGSSPFRFTDTRVLRDRHGFRHHN